MRSPCCLTRSQSNDDERGMAVALCTLGYEGALQLPISSVCLAPIGSMLCRPMLNEPVESPE